MKIRSDALVGVALDWFVAQCESVKTYGPEDFREQRKHVTKNGEYVFRWHQSWQQTGPLIDREHIDLCWAPGTDTWCAYMSSDRHDRLLEIDGPTALVAACRCFVVARLGDEVEVPPGLLHEGEVIGVASDGTDIFWKADQGLAVACTA